MDHNLDDSLNLDSAMGVDFEQPEDTVVIESAMTLDHTTHDEGIPVEFEHNEEQPMLMDTTEEIIDFMGDQISLQEYSVQSDQTTGLTTTVESNIQQQIMSSQSDTLIDMQFQPQMMVSTIKTEMLPPKLIAVKTLPSRPAPKKAETALATLPKQVAIAPKLPKLVPKSYPTKQLPIAPKPVLVSSRAGNTVVKKVSLSGVAQGNTKGNTVLAQIGKQLIMVPSGSQKIKLVSSTGTVPNIQYIKADPEQAQLIPTKSVGGAQTKPVVTKLYAVQGKPNVDSSSQSAVITKILPATSAKTQPRFVTMPQKAVPITFGNKVLMATPSKQGLKLTKKQEIITIKSPTPKLLPAPSLVPVSSGQHKFVITPTSTQNVILKTTAPPKTPQVAKDGSVVVEQQKSQLHQINVPGKGIQYVRIFSNPVPAPKPAPRPMVALNAKTFVLTDNKGNLIQMTAEKMSPGQPPSLLVTGNNSSGSKTKPQQKLVRIAPVVTKTAQAIQQPGRSSQSLLAPLSPVLAPDTSMPDIKNILEVQSEPIEEGTDTLEQNEQVDSKVALRSLIQNTMADDANLDMNEVEIEFKQHHSPPTQENSMDSMEHHDSSGQSEEHPFIVIPAKYDTQQTAMATNDQSLLVESQQMDGMQNMDEETMNSTYQSSTAVSDTDIVSSDLGMRPRKACNCTKSQCLKLYCDCFANGEFCNRCNCCNCHNNLENEELRQKAIRGCLDRNPNAFRPKIGKAKIGGPEIIRRHNKGCNCKRSGCLKNYCECYEAKIACTAICKCVGCRNVEETLDRISRQRNQPRLLPAPPPLATKQPCSFMTTEVIEAVCQCLIAAAVDNKDELDPEGRDVDPMRDVVEEFGRCLQDIISAAHQSTPLGLVDEEPT